MARKLAFKIISDGKQYEIFTDGTVIGFGANPVVFNLIPSLEAQAVLQYRQAACCWHQDSQKPVNWRDEAPKPTDKADENTFSIRGKGDKWTLATDVPLSPETVDPRRRLNHG